MVVTAQKLFEDNWKATGNNQNVYNRYPRGTFEPQKHVEHRAKLFSAGTKKKRLQQLWKRLPEYQKQNWRNQARQQNAAAPPAPDYTRLVAAANLDQPPIDRQKIYVEFHRRDIKETMGRDTTRKRHGEL